MGELMLWMMVLTAHAQSRGLDLDPNYKIYVDAVENLGEPTSFTSNKVVPQLSPGMCGIISLPTFPAVYNTGRLCSLYSQNPPYDWDETLVLDGPAIDASNTTGWTLSFHQVAATPAAQQAYLASLKANNPGVAYKKALFSIIDRVMPTTDELLDQGLISITPASSDYLDLYGFEVSQGGVLVGWMIREKRILTNGTEYVDHWAFTEDYASPGGAIPAAEIDPDGVPWADLSEFFDDIILQAAGNPANPLVSYQRAHYRYKPL
jgi:hypothetical protein